MTEISYSSAIGLLGDHVRDMTTGIAGRVVSVCTNEHQSMQFQIKRYGVDSQGAPFPTYWAYVPDCVVCSRQEAQDA